MANASFQKFNSIEINNCTYKETVLLSPEAYLEMFPDNFSNYNTTVSSSPDTHLDLFEDLDSLDTTQVDSKPFAAPLCRNKQQINELDDKSSSAPALKKKRYITSLDVNTSVVSQPIPHIHKLQCQDCNKWFKNEGALTNHKHKHLHPYISVKPLTTNQELSNIDNGSTSGMQPPPGLPLPRPLSQPVGLLPWWFPDTSKPPPQIISVSQDRPFSAGPCRPVSHSIPSGMQPPPGLPLPRPLSQPVGLLPWWFPDTSKPPPQIFSVSQDRLNPTSQRIMSTASVKRPLQGVALPSPKRSRSSQDLQDFHNFQPTNTYTWWFPDTSKPPPKIVSVSQDRLKPTSSQRILSTASVKRPLQDVALPLPKRFRSSKGLHDFHNSQPTNTDTSASSIARRILIRLAEREFAKRSSDKSCNPNKNYLTPTRIQNTHLGRSKCDLLNSSNPTTRKVIVATNMLAPQNVITNASKPVNRIRRYYKCKFCWRRYSFGPHLDRHREAVHIVQKKKAPKFCANCKCSFTDNAGNGPWNDCCISNLRRYTIRRYIK